MTSGEHILKFRFVTITTPSEIKATLDVNARTIPYLYIGLKKIEVLISFYDEVKIFRDFLTNLSIAADLSYV